MLVTARDDKKDEKTDRGDSYKKEEKRKSTEKSTTPKTEKSSSTQESTTKTETSLKIPQRKGEIITLNKPRRLKSGHYDFEFQEMDRGQDCRLSKEQDNKSAVLILEPGATISNLIIGIKQINAIVCLGSCNLTNVYWRGVCDDALELHGKGHVLVENCHAQNARNKVIQHDSAPGSTLTVKGGSYFNVGQMYRSCGNCRGNSGPRHVVVEGVRIEHARVDVVGLNRNFKDTATISGCCGTVKDVCQVYDGVSSKRIGTKGNSDKLSKSEKSGCLGAQGQLAKLPACHAGANEGTGEWDE